MWNSVVLGFGDEETVNFGSRVESANTNHLYEIHTLATISSSDLVEKNPSVLTCLGEEYIIVALDNCISIFIDECRQILSSQQYNSKVECIATSDDGQLLVVGEQNGTLHSIFLPKMINLAKLKLFSPNDSGHSYDSVQFISQEKGKATLAVLGSSGDLLITAIDLESIRKAAAKEDWSALTKIITNGEQQKFNLNDFYPGSKPVKLMELRTSYENNLACFRQDAPHIMILFGHEFYPFPLSVSEADNTIKKVVSSRSSSYIFVLDNQSCLHVLSSVTILEVRAWKQENILNFSLVETYALNGDVETQKLVLLVADNNSSFCRLEIRAFPSFELCYTLQLSCFSWIIGSLSNQEEFLILEGGSKLNDHTLLDSVRLRALSQSSPETRLAQLLRRGEFEEAEKLAQLFRLEIEQVYKAQISQLLDNYTPWKPCEFGTFSANQIKVLLMKIKDLEFVVECCLLAALPSAKDTNDLLLFARQQAEKSTHPLAAKWVENTTSCIQKLDTFLMLYPNDKDWLLWFEFSRKKVQQLFLELLNSSNTDKALFFWEILKGEVSAMKPTDLELILQALPDNIPSRELSPFFQEHFLPQIIAFSPDCIDILAEWMMNRIQWLEIDISENEQWPTNGLTFLKILPQVCENLMSLCQIGGINTSVELDIHILQRKSFTPNDPFCSLLSMIGDMEQLQTLKDKYDCHISLENFRREDKTLVIFLLLDRLVASKFFEEFSNQFLRNYTKQYDLDLDTVFTQYIEDTLSAFRVSWWDVCEEESLWEQRALVIFSHIVDPDLRVQALLDMVSHSPLPWSQSILQIVQAQLLNHHCRNSELQDQVRLSHFKAVLLKYNLHTFSNIDFNQPHLAVRLLKFVLKQGKPSSLEDALEIAQGFKSITEVDVHFLYMRTLLEQFKVDDFLDHFSNLKPTNSLLIGEKFLIYTFDHLNFSSHSSSQKHLDALIQGCLSMSTNLKQKFPLAFPPLQEDLEYLNIISCFQKEFNLYIKPCALSSIPKKWEIFNQHMEFLLHNKDDGTLIPEAVGKCVLNSSNMTTVKLYRMAAILGLPAEEAFGRLAVVLAESGDSNQALEICREMISMGLSSEENLHSLILHFLSNLSSLTGEHANILTSVFQLCSNLLLICKPGNLLECIQLSQFSRQLCYLLALDSHVYSAEEVSRSDRYNRWSFSPLYKDQGLRIQINILLPLLVKCFTALRRSIASRGVDSEPESANVEIFALCRQVLLHMKSKGQETAGLQFLLFAQTLNSDNFTDEILLSQKKAIKDTCKLLISRIVSQRKVDLICAFGLLCLHESNIRLEILKELSGQYAKDYNHLKWIAKLGIEFGRICKIPVMSEKCSRVFKSSSWMSRLAKLQITIKNNDSLSNPDSASKILEETFPLNNLDLILEFCREFDLNKVPALLSYLQFMLTRPQIRDWGTSSSQPTEDQLLELKSTLSKADEVIAGIQISSHLRDTLHSLLIKTNCYCYEVIEWLLNKIANLEQSVDTSSYGSPFDFEKGMSILRFLKLYKRIEEPIEFELDIWLSENPQHDHLPSISSVRLPYHAVSQDNMKDKWKVINQELYSSNIQVWINMGPLLQLDSDQLLVTAAQNEVMCWLKRHQLQRPENCLHKPSPTTVGQGSRQDAQFLTILQGLILKIQNMDMATATASWIVKRLPPGANKVAVAKASVLLASQWFSQSPNSRDASGKLERLQGIYHRLAVEQELERFSLNTPENLALAQNPSMLINHLLEELGKEGLFHTNQQQQFRAIEEIAKIGDCDLMDIYQSRLEFWMPTGDVAGADADISMTICMNNFNLESPLAADEREASLNLNRTISLFREIADDDLFILQIKAFLDNWKSLSSFQRAQGLRSLFSVADNEKISSLSEDHSPEDLWEYLQHSVYIARLESLHMPYTIQMFAQCNKEDLVESVLVSHGHNPKALLFCSSLCSQYKIWKQVYWDIILNNMTDLNLVENLHCVLWQINSVPRLWHSPSLLRAWECLLKGSIIAASSSIDVNKAMVNVYTTFINCPCYLAINKERLADDFECQGQPFLALCCLLTNEIGHHNKEQTLKCFLERHSIPKLKNEMEIIKKTIPSYKLVIFSKATDLLN